MADDDNELGAVTARVEAVSAVRRIVHAIWVVSRAQHARALRMTSESVAYFRWVDDVVSRLAGPPAATTEPRVCLFLGPERPLCGGLGTAVEAAVREAAAAGHSYALVGSRLMQNAELVRGARFATAGATSDGDVEALARELGVRILREAPATTVELIFPMAAGRALHRELLLAAHRVAPQLGVDTYSPPAALLRAALEQALSGRVAHALAQTLQAELEARIQLTQRATKHCDERLHELHLSARVLHKEEITRELGEVVTARLNHAHQGAGQTP